MEKKINLCKLLMAAVTTMLLALPGAAFASEFTVDKNTAIQKEKVYSPFVDQHFPTQVLWGDTHLHTANSVDAGFVGNKLGPAEAYRFARGEEVTSSTGLRVKLLRPLDFLVIADHAEYFGLATMIKNGNPALLADPVGSTVNIPDASYTNTIGDPLLTAFWKDPDFDSKQRAVYYVRVIEIPKPRWTAYDAKYFGVKMADNVVMTVQDRAYTSPIWYTP